MGNEPEIKKMFNFMLSNPLLEFFGPKYIISKHFQTCFTFGTVINYHTNVLHVEYELWKHKDIKI